MELLSTVNVIELTDCTIQGLSTWPDTTEGNQEAEKYFRQCVKECGDENETEESINAAIENGVFSDESETYTIYLTHSKSVYLTHSKSV